MKTVTDLQRLWPSYSIFAEDIGVTYNVAAAMRQRGTINPRYYPAIVHKAQERNIYGVSMMGLFNKFQAPAR